MGCPGEERHERQRPELYRGHDATAPDVTAFVARRLRPVDQPCGDEDSQHEGRIDVEHTGEEAGHRRDDRHHEPNVTQLIVDTGSQRDQQRPESDRQGDSDRRREQRSVVALAEGVVATGEAPCAKSQTPTESGGGQAERCDDEQCEHQAEDESPDPGPAGEALRERGDVAAESRRRRP